MTDEVINIAVIVDFSRFNEIDKISNNNLVKELSKFLLFLQTWHRTIIFKKRKLNISYQILSNIYHQKYYRRQYFAEFDSKIWKALCDQIYQSMQITASNNNIIKANEIEKHFITQLQKFVNDFYWENGDLSSPGFCTNSLSQIPHLASSKKNIALYITSQYYPITIDGKNTLRATIDNLHKNGIAFIWLSEIADSNILDSVINCLSLFNGNILPFSNQKYHFSISTFKIDSFIHDLKPVNNEVKLKINRKRDTLALLVDTSKCYQSPICIQFNGVTFTLYTYHLERPCDELSFIFIRCLSDCHQNLHKFLPVNTFHLYLNKSDITFLKNTDNESHAIILLKNLRDDSLWIIQRINNLPFCYLFQIEDNLDFNLLVNQDNLKMNDVLQYFKPFESWFNFSSLSQSFINAFKDQIINRCEWSLDNSSGFKTYMNNCIKNEHITLMDSHDSSKLKQAFGFINHSQDTSKLNTPLKNSVNHENHQITEGFARCESLFLEVSRFYSTNEEKIKYFQQNYLHNVNVLINECNESCTPDTIDKCKMQVLLRIFILNKFDRGHIRATLLMEVVELLRKLSLCKMPSWVGHFLDHDIVSSIDISMNKELRYIYDELMQPYPNSLRSPSVKSEFSFPSSNEALKTFEPTLNFTKYTNQSSLNEEKPLILKSNSFIENGSKRREITIMSRLPDKLFISKSRLKPTLQNVKRSLFGNVRADTSNLRRCFSESKAQSRTIFTINKDYESSSSYDNGCKGNPSKFYSVNSNSISSINDTENLQPNEPLKKMETIDYFNSSNVTPSKNSPSDTIISSFNSPKIYDKKYSIPNTYQINNLTPWKYYANLISLSPKLINQYKSPIKNDINIPVSDNNVIFKTPPSRLPRNSSVSSNS